MMIELHKYCSQSIIYGCINLPLINGLTPSYATFISSKDLKPSQSWAGADRSDIVGCACALLGTCPPGYSCHCDARSRILYEEQGLIINRDALPVVGVMYGGVSDETSSGYISIGRLGCASYPFCEL